MSTKTREGYKDQEKINLQFGNINGLSYYPSFENRRLDLRKSFCKKITFYSTMLLDYPCGPPDTSNFTTLHYNNLERSDVQKIAILFNDSFALMSGPAF